MVSDCRWLTLCGSILCIIWNKGVMGEEFFKRVAGVCRRVKHLLASYEEGRGIKWKERHPEFYALERVGVTRGVTSTAVP